MTEPNHCTRPIAAPPAMLDALSLVGSSLMYSLLICPVHSSTHFAFICEFVHPALICSFVSDSLHPSLPQESTMHSPAKLSVQPWYYPKGHPLYKIGVAPGVCNATLPDLSQHPTLCHISQTFAHPPPKPLPTPPKPLAPSQTPPPLTTFATIPKPLPTPKPSSGQQEKIPTFLTALLRLRPKVSPMPLLVLPLFLTGTPSSSRLLMLFMSMSVRWAKRCHCCWRASSIFSGWVIT